MSQTNQLAITDVNVFKSNYSASFIFRLFVFVPAVWLLLLSFYYMRQKRYKSLNIFYLYGAKTIVYTYSKAPIKADKH